MQLGWQGHHGKPGHTLTPPTSSLWICFLFFCLKQSVFLKGLYKLTSSALTHDVPNKELSKNGLWLRVEEVAVHSCPLQLNGAV